MEFNPFGMSWPLIISMAATSAIAIVVPLVAGFIALRRLEGSLWHVALGIGTFLIFQVVTRIPLVAVAGLALQDVLAESEVVKWIWIVVLSFSAGLFEEGGRWVAYRWGFKAHDEKTWDKAVLMGIGHGGFESALLVGLSVGATLGVMLFLSPEMLGADPTAMAQLEAAAQQTWWMPLLGGWERVMSMCFHVALSVAVVQFWLRGGWQWVVGAMVVHGLGNLVVVATLQLLSEQVGAQAGALAAEGVMLLVGVGSLAWLAWTRKAGGTAQPG